MIRFTSVENKQFWEKYAVKKRESPSGAHSDWHIVNLENRFLISQLDIIKPKSLLEIGCGNGQRTLLMSRQVRGTVKGIDYSHEMIKQAKKMLAKKKNSLKKRITFETSDILQYDDENKYDVIVSCRCIINQINSQSQWKLFEKLYQLLKANGSLIIAEGSHEGYKRLNNYRKKFGLEPINVAWYNIPIREKTLFPKLKKKFKIIKINRLGTYYYYSRIIYPLVIFPKKPNVNNKINDLALENEIEYQSFFDDSNNIYEKYGAHLLVHLIKK